MGVSDKKHTPANLVAGNFSGSCLLQLTISLQMSGILIPYSLSLQRNYFDPPLPFISQAVGCIPENGLFTFWMIPASFFALIVVMSSSSSLAFGSVNDKLFQFLTKSKSFILSFLIHTKQTGVDRSQKLINSFSLWSSISYFFSWIIISAFPVAYTDVPNKFEWVCFVLWEHMIGALLMLGSCVFFSTFQSVLFWNEKIWKAKLRVSVVVIPVAIIGIYSLLRVGLEELDVKGGLSMQDVTYDLPSKFSFHYVLTAICEWILLSSMWLSFGLFYDQLKDVAVYICVQRKTLQ